MSKKTEAGEKAVIEQGIRNNRGHTPHFAPCYTRNAVCVPMRPEPKAGESSLIV